MTSIHARNSQNRRQIGASGTADAGTADAGTAGRREIVPTLDCGTAWIDVVASVSPACARGRQSPAQTWPPRQHDTARRGG
ncbi:MAG: hypothetical protein ACLP8X_43945 [Streptosporangiaceae bacterium]